VPGSRVKQLFGSIPEKAKKNRAIQQNPYLRESNDSSSIFQKVLNVNASRFLVTVLLIGF
jgi:hypothetical protein